MSIISFLKKWTLICAIAFGTVIYLLFSEIPLLQPIGNVAGPWCANIVPYVIFALLYVTFCKIDMENMRPRAWHFWLQFIRTAISGTFVLLIMMFGDISQELKLVLEGCFICFICPTAASAAVVTEKLGGSIASLTVYTLIASIVTSIIIPLFFPMVEKGSDITFIYAFMMILRRVVAVLLLPLCLALLTRRFAQIGKEDKKLQKPCFLHVGLQPLNRHRNNDAQHHRRHSGRMHPLPAACTAIGGHSPAVQHWQMGGRILWRQSERRTGSRTEEHYCGHLAHRHLPQPCGCSGPRRIRAVAESRKFMAAVV